MRPGPSSARATRPALRAHRSEWLRQCRHGRPTHSARGADARAARPTDRGAYKSPAALARPLRGPPCLRPNPSRRDELALLVLFFGFLGGLLGFFGGLLG